VVGVVGMVGYWSERSLIILDPTKVATTGKIRPQHLQPNHDLTGSCIIHTRKNCLSKGANRSLQLCNYVLLGAA
jgi:hypothetical protein